jgi:thiamine-monophosphate kinase
LINLWGAQVDAVIRAATAGDDYEIAFTAPASLRQVLEAAASEVGVAIVEIGRVEAGSGVTLLDESGQALRVEKSGFTHF